MVDGLLTGGDEHFVAAVQGEDVEGPLPVGPVGVRGGVAVVGVVEGEAVRDGRRLLHRLSGGGQPLGEGELGAVPGDVRPADVLEVPVDSGQRDGRAGGGDLDTADGAGDPEPLLAGEEREVELVGVVGQ